MVFVIKYERGKVEERKGVNGRLGLASPRSHPVWGVTSQ
jgi:hypothetical protein